MEFLDLFKTFIGPLVAAFGAYAAIRADLAAMRVQLAMMEKSLEKAHERIDALTHRGQV
jgi:hypothetical protein